MVKARCPLCGELYGPLVIDLLRHLKNDHNQAAEWEEDTGNIKLAGWLPGTLVFVKEEEP